MKKKIINTTKNFFFSLLFIMVVTYIGSYALIVIPTLKKVKNERHKQNINKLISMTSQEFDSLTAILQDNAQWGTLYQKMDGSSSKEENQIFFKDLFTENSLNLFGLDYIGIYDTKQNEIINYSISGKNVKNAISLKGKKYFFSSQTKGKNRAKIVSGYIDINKKAYMFFSHMILRNDGSGDFVGYLLFFEEIDKNYISDLEIKNNLSLELYIPNENDGEFIKKIITYRENSDFYSEKKINGKRVYYVPYMKNVHEIAYIIKVIIDDNIYDEYLLSFLIGLIPIIILVLFIIFMKNRLNEKLVDPIMSLYKHIVSVKKNKKYELLKYPSVENEIDEVIEVFNNLMIQIEEQKIALEKLAYIDHLTGLATRRFLDEKYELLFQSAKRTENILTLIMMDIDFFKKYNDKYGHLKGDDVLKIIGKLLNETFKREGDVIGRYGGEEFLVILYQTPLEETLRLANEFQKKLVSCNIKHEDSHLKKITVSMGIKCSTILKDQNSYLFLEEVDKALYKAKESGRNKYILEL
ncbi:MAG: hypothetical protein B6227_01945 [Fusobacteriia bacterium 4572_74]|nr:MAG: hypothetical protein B6227_01945 [Fusobacteriia bacterium 4572_74]